MTQFAQGGARVELDDLVERHVASVCTSIDCRRLQRTVNVLHELVMDIVGEQGLAPAGPLFCRYHRLDTVVTLEAGLPLAQPVRPTGVIAAGTLPGGPTLRARHVGVQPAVVDRLAELERYCQLHGLRGAGAPWEYYLVDARDTADQEEWVSEICLPVRPIRTLPRRTSFGRGRSCRVALPSRQAVC